MGTAAQDNHSSRYGHNPCYQMAVSNCWTSTGHYMMGNTILTQQEGPNACHGQGIDGYMTQQPNGTMLLR